MRSSLHNILITGGGGQLAQALRNSLPLSSNQCLPKQALDITDLKQVQSIIAKYKPSYVINTAAYTQVDKAESEKGLAEQINHQGPRNLAIVCEHYHIPLIHISTDYVFDGAKLSPYKEDDATTPINFYGMSKLQGEIAIKEYCEQALILRVSGIFSEYRQNFLKTMCQLAQDREELRIVSDQFTCPTYAIAIADVLIQIMSQPFKAGTYHFCSQPATSWYEFASAIIATYKQYRPTKVNKVIAIPSSDYRTAAKRPNYSALDCQKIYDRYAISQPSWHDGITACIKALCRGKE